MIIDETQEKDLEWGRWLFCQSCDFMRGVPALQDLPPIELPEVAFAGRSNVGKSSLLNALTGRNSLARTSHTPGRTQQLNFFNLGNRLCLVDMPGYGYASASKTQIASWTALMKQYLRGRPSLQRVYLLIDSRQGIGKNDIEMMELLDQTAVSYQIVLTKIDKLKPGPLESVYNKSLEIIRTHPAAHPEIMTTSSNAKKGINELQATIAKFAVKDPS